MLRIKHHHDFYTLRTNHSLDEFSVIWGIERVEDDEVMLGGCRIDDGSNTGGGGQQ